MITWNRKLSRLALFALFLGLLMPAASRTVLAEEAPDDSLVIEEGVTANGFELGGMTVEEARETLNTFFETAADSKLTVSFGEQTASVKLSSLSLSWDVDSALEKAASLGKTGPLIARYKEQKDLKASSVAVDVAYTYDKEAVESFVRKKIAAKDGDPQDAQITREDGEFVITPEVAGQTTDVDQTVAAITEVLDNNLSDHMTATAVVELTEAEVTEEDLSTISNCLGTYSTNYSSSASGRKTNIKVGSGNINGSVLMPGESLSVSDTMKPRTTANGYKKAPQYANGQSEMAVGGGVCQVSTTLYNAVLRAELQVDERHPHSMVVSYVPYSSDAAIASGSKDFVFTNNQDTPIYIAASADGSTLTFSIYGKETRPSNRTIEFVSTTLSKSTPSPITKVDYSMAEGKKVTSGSTHPAVSSTLTKIVYVDGEEVSREVLNKDSYRGSAKTITIGGKKKEKETETSEETKETETETKKSKKKETTEETKEETKKKSKKETTEETKKKSKKETTEETKKKSKKETTEETKKKTTEEAAESGE